MNSIIKRRELFRPFAPTVLYEEAAKYFDDFEHSPYMLRVFNVKTEFIDKIPAVIHVDNTARIQSLKRDENSFFYDLINNFFSLSQIPMVLNTSFNFRGEPIVNSPEDAIKFLISSELKYLFINNLIICKN